MLSASRSQAARRAIDGEDLRARRSELGRLAAGRGAKVGDPLARLRPEKAGGQRRRRVLHPPGALVVARKLADGRAVQQADAAGREDEAVEARGPAFRLGLHGEIDGGGVPVRGGDPAGVLLAVGGRPALGQPARRVDAERVGLRENAVPLARDPAQDGVGDAGQVPDAPVALGEAHREVDGGVVRHVEDENLRRADGEERQRPLVRRQALGQALGERRPDRAEAPEGHGRDRPGKGLVAGIEPRPRQRGRRGCRRAPRGRAAPRPPPPRRGGGREGRPGRTGGPASERVWPKRRACPVLGRVGRLVTRPAVARRLRPASLPPSHRREKARLDVVPCRRHLDRRGPRAPCRGLVREADRLDAETRWSAASMKA